MVAKGAYLPTCRKISAKNGNQCKQVSEVIIRNLLLLDQLEVN